MLFILLISRTFGASIPINVSDNLNPRQMAPATGQGYQLRTLYDIIWSCLSTLFICTWVAIHPNVPPRSESFVRSLWRRIDVMFLALLVPELILVWAYKQWAAASYIAELFKDEGWSPIHGHFLIMGGFNLVQDGDEIVLDYESFLGLMGIPGHQHRFKESIRIAFPAITVAEIKDKSKGDFLSKAIAVLQSIWFIVQCAARGIEGLALTELELVTLALASLTGVMYYLWWDKPLGVKEPIKVYPVDIDPPKKVIEGGAARLERFQASVQAASQLSFFHRFLRSPIQQFIRHFHSIFSSIYHRLSIISLTTIQIFLLLCFPITFFIFSVAVIFKEVVDIPDTEDILPNAAHVPTFYAPDSLSSNGSEFLFFFILPTITTIFGALHLIAWHFHFPSHIEQLLWRTGSLIVTIIPFALIAIGLLVYVVGMIPKLPSIHFLNSLPTPMVLESIGVFIGVVGIIGYILARLLLLTEAMVLLRKQPETALYTINWIRFLPHL